MVPLGTLTVQQLLDAFASSEPLPAGGSASALAGASGASLLIMAATLPKTKNRTADEAAALAEAAASLRPLRDELTSLMDKDAEAYTSLLAALRLPKDSPDQATHRRSAIQDATRLATDVPLQTMRAGREALRLAVTVAANCARPATGDVAVALELLCAAVRGAGGAVDSNLPSMIDTEYVARVRTVRQEFQEESERDAQRARAAL